MIRRLLKKDVAKPLDYLNLVRLNPAIPFKTRGNGAVALRIAVREQDVEKVVNETLKVIDEYVSEFNFRPKSEPGVLILKGIVPKRFHRIYLKAVSDYVPPDIVKSALSRCANAVIHASGGRGLVGAAAAIGWPEGRDCTYELLTYRDRAFWGKQRHVDVNSVRAFDKVAANSFLNLSESREPLICPEGPDPVLYGVRGDDPQELLKALHIIKVREPIAGWAIFRTNQHTNDHLVLRDASSIRPYQTACVDASVSSKPISVRSAVLVPLQADGAAVFAAGFRESGLHKVLQSLTTGDFIRVCGAVRLWEGVGLVVNAELVLVRFLVKNSLRMGRCPRCGSRMKSLGRCGGMKCMKCGFKVNARWFEAEALRRRCSEGLYLPPPSSFKHLMKPRQRYGRERACFFSKPVSGWIG